MQASAVLLDLDGVIYEGDRAIDGAAATVALLQQHRVPHLFLTNTTSRPRQALVDKLADMGITTDTEHLLTPPVVATRWLTEHASGPAALFVPAATRADLGDIDTLPDDADHGAHAVVIGDLGKEWDFARLNHAFRLLMAGAPHFLALGMTRYWQAEDGLRLDVGAFTSALSFACGREPLIMGKPAEAFFDIALKQLGSTSEQTLMVGDDVQSDILGASWLGLQTALVRTGKYRPDDEERLPGGAEVIDDITELPRLLGIAADN